MSRTGPALVLAAVLGLLPARLPAASLLVCYNFGCRNEAAVNLDDTALADMERVLAYALDADDERVALSGVLARLYRWAGRFTPIASDLGGNDRDTDLDGRMDCIDHSTTTTRMLALLAADGVLRFHEPGEPARRRRWLLFEHRTAVIRARDGGEYAVDTWFRDHGEPAVILPLSKWLSGGGDE